MTKKRKRILVDMFMSIVGVMLFSFYLLKILRNGNYSPLAFGACALGFAHVAVLVFTKKLDNLPFLMTLLLHPAFAFASLGAVLRVGEFLFAISGYDLRIFHREFYLCLGVSSWLGMFLNLAARNLLFVPKQR